MVAADIRLRGVSKRYALGETTIEALRPLDLDIEQGEFIAITGPSGSGKSTLANVVGGLDTPDTGTVTVGGVDLNGASDVELSRYRSTMMGFVFQSFNLQSDSSVLENVVLPLIIAKVPREDRVPMALESLRAVGLEDRAEQPVNQLSGGQRQRVAIARAIANRPGVVIADEPTGNLDRSSGRMVMEHLRRLNEEAPLTLLLVTHDPDQAAMAPRRLRIEDGLVTDSGAA